MSRRIRSPVISSLRIVTSLLDAMQEAALLLDKEGSVLMMNQSAQEVLGKPREDDHQTFHAEEFFADSGNFLSLVKECLANDTHSATGELEAVDESGEKIRLSASLRALPGPARKPYLVMTLAPLTKETRLLRDAREMGRRVEKLHRTLREVRAELLERTLQLSEQKNKMLAILRGMADGLLVCDKRGSIIQYNDTAREILNLPEGDLENRPLAQLCPQLAELLGLTRKTTVPPVRTTHEEKFTVGHRDVRASVAPIFDNRNRYLGLVMVLQDRTKQAEVDRMKSDLISIVSHELRSPLTSIKGYVDLMMSGELGEVPAAQRKYLEIVLNNADRLTNLINDMLDLSRIETGKLAMTFGKVDIKYLCDLVYIGLKPQASQKQLDFQLYVTEGLAVSGDVERLQQALTNLVSNAIKYTPQGGSVRIAAYRQNADVRIDVIDTGFGISADDRKRLFDKFFRVKNAKTRHIGGTGLGLCITKSIVEAHDGRISVESVENEGSTFTIFLPQYQA